MGDLRAQLQRAQEELAKVQRSMTDSLSSTGADLQSARAEVARLTAALSVAEKDLGSSREEARQTAAALEATKKQVPGRCCVCCVLCAVCCVSRYLCSQTSMPPHIACYVVPTCVPPPCQLSQVQREAQDAAKEAVAKLAVGGTGQMGGSGGCCLHASTFLMWALLLLTRSAPCAVVAPRRGRLRPANETPPMSWPVHWPP